MSHDRLKGTLTRTSNPHLTSRLPVHTLVRVLDRVRTTGTSMDKAWGDWKSARPELFGKS